MAESRETITPTDKVHYKALLTKYNKQIAWCCCCCCWRKCYIICAAMPKRQKYDAKNIAFNQFTNKKQHIHIKAGLGVSA